MMHTVTYFFIYVYLSRRWMHTRRRAGWHTHCLLIGVFSQNWWITWKCVDPMIHTFIYLCTYLCIYRRWMMNTFLTLMHTLFTLMQTHCLLWCTHIVYFDAHTLFTLIHTLFTLTNPLFTYWFFHSLSQVDPDAEARRIMNSILQHWHELKTLFASLLSAAPSPSLVETVAAAAQVTNSSTTSSSASTSDPINSPESVLPLTIGLPDMSVIATLAVTI